jgi:hypothetical protein
LVGLKSVDYFTSTQRKNPCFFVKIKLADYSTPLGGIS